MAFNVLESIDVTERLSFSQNFGVKRPTVLDTLFPDVKSQYLEAEYYRQMQGQNLPTAAFVHALDTEANIGVRPTFEKVLQEKLFIKEKINQSEKIQLYIKNGVPDDDSLISWVYDDAARLSESVVTRTLAAKGEVMGTGKMTIKENNLNMTIDFGIPSSNKTGHSGWGDVDHDILSDIEADIKVLTDQGYTPNKMLTSNTQLSRMRKNNVIQKAILGVYGEGTLLTKAQLDALFAEEFGVTIEVCDEQFAYIKADGTRSNHRYFGEDKVTYYTAEATGRIGTGLWGPTPEEAELLAKAAEVGSGVGTEGKDIFVTTTMWETPDPVAKWTKASGMFVPVLPSPYSMFIATITA